MGAYTDAYLMLRAIRMHVEANEGHKILCADNPTSATIGFVCDRCYDNYWYITCDDLNKYIDKAPDSHRALLRFLFVGSTSRLHIAALLSQPYNFDPKILAIPHEGCHENVSPYSSIRSHI